MNLFKLFSSPQLDALFVEWGKVGAFGRPYNTQIGEVITLKK